MKDDFKDDEFLYPSEEEMCRLFFQEQVRPKLVEALGNIQFLNLTADELNLFLMLPASYSLH